MSKLIDADKLREQIGTRADGECYDDFYEGLQAAYSRVAKLIDEAPDLSLTWEDMRTIVKIADELAEYAEAGIIEPFLSSEESYYKEVLKRFNMRRK